MHDVVMVPLDGTDKDTQALALGVSLASLGDARLHLLRVLDPNRVGEGARSGLYGVAEERRTRRETLAQELSATAERLAGSARRLVTSEVLDAADVADAILARATERDARVIVMGTRAAGVVGRALVGSVADRVAREATIPVVLVPPRAAAAETDLHPPVRVLIPLDGSPASQAILDRLLLIVPGEHLDVLLMEVIPSAHPSAWAAPVPPPVTSIASPDLLASRELSAAARSASEKRLAAAAEGLRARGAAADMRIVEGDLPAAAIANAALEAGVAIIAMSTRGQGGLRRAVLGSVTEDVLRRSSVPVLISSPRAGIADAGSAPHPD
jgi:nucleotide-binding universal stress UspA family protein